MVIFYAINVSELSFNLNQVFSFKIGKDKFFLFCNDRVVINFNNSNLVSSRLFLKQSSKLCVYAESFLEGKITYMDERKET